jgi:transcriptional regulator GlxA family with amidase domain
MDLTTHLGRDFVDGLGLLQRSFARPDNILQRSLAAEHFEHFIAATLLLAQPHNYSDELLAPSTPALPRHIQRVVEVIESRPDHPWTAASLASHACVSMRSLQEGFARHLGVSPMKYLRDVRLGRVRAQLMAADSVGGMTVSDVASRWGFVHLGRFTEAYRNKFGELPSQTLRSAR